MRNRGDKFWEWADRELHSRYHEERLQDGTLIDVQSRLSRQAVTQLFVGVYRKDGLMLLEEYYAERPGQTISQALVWGADRARLFGTNGGLNIPVDSLISARPKPTAFNK